MVKKYLKNIDWYNFFTKKKIVNYLLLPISWLYISLVHIRILLYKLNIKKTKKFNIPVIIVGNIVVGGSGKTPLTIAIVNKLKDKFNIGIVSRGYGRDYSKKSIFIDKYSDPKIAGDEPVLIATKTQTPVCVNNNRCQAIQDLIDKYNINLIFSDDGLQHYKLSRFLEIVVIGTKPSLGNKMYLPSGPLREPISRLKAVDYIIKDINADINMLNIFNTENYSISFNAKYLINLKSGKKVHYKNIFFKNCVAISGIANPNKFHSILKQWQLTFIIKNFSDHHNYIKEDFLEFANYNIIITEKDYVKCRLISMDMEKIWYMPISIVIDNSFYEQLQHRISQFKSLR